jgi:nuclear pore complex protein Nup98-Nup96
VFPVLRSSEYFTRPSIDELVEREAADPGYHSRIPNFVIEGWIWAGQVRFLGNIDVRGIDLNDIIRFDKHSVVVYEDETCKPLDKHCC